MTPERFKECLSLLCWSQRKLAYILHISSRRPSSWASGKNTIPDPVATWLEALASHAEQTPPPHDYSKEIQHHDDAT